MPQSENLHPNPLTSLSNLQTSQQAAGTIPRRQPTPEQGRALESLGHAVEYLIDEGLLCGDAIDINVTEAVHLLSQASRSLYLSCAESPRTLDRRAKGATHIRWKWIPAAPFMLPMFRDPSVHAASREGER